MSSGGGEQLSDADRNKQQLKTNHSVVVSAITKHFLNLDKPLDENEMNLWVLIIFLNVLTEDTTCTQLVLTQFGCMATMNQFMWGQFLIAFNNALKLVNCPKVLREAVSRINENMQTKGHSNHLIQMVVDKITNLEEQARQKQAQQQAVAAQAAPPSMAQMQEYIHNLQTENIRLKEQVAHLQGNGSNASMAAQLRQVQQENEKLQAQIDHEEEVNTATGIRVDVLQKALTKVYEMGANVLQVISAVIPLSGAEGAVDVEAADGGQGPVPVAAAAAAGPRPRGPVGLRGRARCYPPGVQLQRIEAAAAAAESRVPKKRPRVQAEEVEVEVDIELSNLTSHGMEAGIDTGPGPVADDGLQGREPVGSPTGVETGDEGSARRRCQTPAGFKRTRKSPTIPGVPQDIWDYMPTEQRRRAKNYVSKGWTERLDALCAQVEHAKRVAAGEASGPAGAGAAPEDGAPSPRFSIKRRT